MCGFFGGLLLKFWPVSFMREPGGVEQAAKSAEANLDLGLICLIQGSNQIFPSR